MGKEAMCVFISGPITGHPDYKENFGAAARHLKRSGYKVLNPAELPEGLTPADYMRICLSMVDTADAVATLPGCLYSRGANIEVLYATYIGKPVRPWTAYGQIGEKREELAL